MKKCNHDLKDKYTTLEYVGRQFLDTGDLIEIFECYICGKRVSEYFKSSLDEDGVNE